MVTPWSRLALDLATHCLCLDHGLPLPWSHLALALVTPCPCLGHILPLPWSRLGHILPLPWSRLAKSLVTTFSRNIHCISKVAPIQNVREIFLIVLSFFDMRLDLLYKKIKKKMFTKIIFMDVLDCWHRIVRLIFSFKNVLWAY